MHPEELHHFELLKKKIVSIMQQSYPGINPSISEWKGQEIVDFQEDLLKKVNAHVSEKWFYTHMKAAHRTLPRIDVLNILSKYAGYTNWDDFVFRNGAPLNRRALTAGANRYFFIIPLLLVAVMCIFYLLFRLLSTHEYRFSFYDADTREAITGGTLTVTLLPENESPVSYLCQPGESFVLKTDKSRIRMVVNAPYYKSDTITRLLNKFNRNETVGLHVNDYALMIHYFSTMNVADWKSRRSSLDKMIDDGAMIYQVYDGKKNMGMQLYNKWEFIDRLTMPTGSLRQIDILDTKFSAGKISVLRFRINNEQK